MRSYLLFLLLLVPFLLDAQDNNSLELISFVPSDMSEIAMEDDLLVMVVKGDILFYSLEEPYSPKLINYFKDNYSCHPIELEISDSHLLCVCPDTIKIYDISDSLEPVLKVSYFSPYTITGMCHHEQYIYISRSVGVAVLKISPEYDEITQISNYTMLPDLINIAVSDSILVAHSYYKAYIFSIADPYNPVYITSFEPIEFCGTTVWIRDVALNSTNLYFAATLHGIMSYDISNPEEPQLLHTQNYGYLASPRSIYLFNDFAIIDGEPAKYVFSIESPGNLILKSLISEPIYAESVIKDTVLYSVSGTRGLDIHKFNQATGNLTEIKNFAGCIGARKSMMNDDLLIFCDNQYGIQFCHVGDDNFPTEKAFFDLDEHFSYLDHSKNIYYAGTGSNIRTPYSSQNETAEDSKIIRRLVPGKVV